MARPVKGAKPGFLPSGAMDMFRRRAVQLGGLGVMGVAGLILAALITFHPGDPNLNIATDGPVANALGRPGAVAADLVLQFFGLAGLLPLAILVAWGARLVVKAHGPARPRLRLASLTLSLPLGATSLALAWPAVPPLPAGAGGAIGALLATPVLAHIPAPGWALALAGGGLALAGTVFALGLTGAEWRRAGAIVVRLAALVGVAAGKSGRAISAAKDAAAARAVRTEPHLSQDSVPVPEAAAVWSPDDADDDDDQVISPPPKRPSAPRTAPPPPPKEMPKDLVVPREAKLAAGKREQATRQGMLDLGELPEGYDLPPLDLLALPPQGAAKVGLNEEALAQNARLLESVLEDFGVNGQVVKVRPGPVVTLYELEPAPGTKTSRVIGLADDIARSMSALSVRIAVIPGRSVIGIELPNAKRETVFLRELLASDAFEKAAARLTLVLGKDIGGAPVMVDLAKMPHLLIAGTTGSGKSVAVNTMICSLLYRLSPAECRLIMIDPKMLELSVYDGIPHLLAPVVTEPAKAIVALKWAVREMEDRYRAMSQVGVRNIGGYNQRLGEARAKGEVLTRTVQTGFDGETGKPIYEDQALDLEALPFIVVIVDEMADLMLVAGKDVEAAIQRLAQMARAAGIHLIMATQRPSVDVITGTIKANFPTRISFQVTSKIDSRTILGEQGAEQLLGQGDMLYMASGGRISRVHGPFVSDQEVEAIVDHLRGQGEPAYLEAVTEEADDGPFGQDGGGGGGKSDGEDALYDQAVSLVSREGKASTSFVQRHLQIGYNRAARIIERMESEGVVSKANHVGKREVLVRSSAEY